MATYWSPHQPHYIVTSLSIPPPCGGWRGYGGYICLESFTAWSSQLCSTPVQQHQERWIGRWRVTKACSYGQRIIRSVIRFSYQLTCSTFLDEGEIFSEATYPLLYGLQDRWWGDYFDTTCRLPRCQLQRLGTYPNIAYLRCRERRWLVSKVATVRPGCD